MCTYFKIKSNIICSLFLGSRRRRGVSLSVEYGWPQPQDMAARQKKVRLCDVDSKSKERCNLVYVVFTLNLIPIPDYSCRTKAHCRITAAAHLLWPVGLLLRREPLWLCDLNVRLKPRTGSPQAGGPPPPSRTPPTARSKPWTGSHPAGRPPPPARTPPAVRPKPRTGSPPAGRPPPPARPIPTGRPSPVE